MHNEADAFTRFTHKIDAFFNRHVKTVVFSVAVVAVGLAAFFVISGVVSSRQKEADQAFGKVYTAYDNIENKDSEGAGPALLKLIDSFQVVIDEHPGTRAASKSGYLAGNILYRAGQYEKALKYYETGAGVKSDQYSALLSLQGAAKCQEQLEQYQDAIATYQRLLSEFPDSFLVPEARYSLGQLYEQLDMPEDAGREYKLIIDSYDWSGWSAMAEKKLLVLRSIGAIDTAGGTSGSEGQAGGGAGVSE